VTKAGTDFALRLMGPLALLLLWHVLSVSGLANPRLLPAPDATFARLGEMLAGAGLAQDLIETLARTGAGYGLAAVVGVVLGLAIGSFQHLHRFLEAPLDFFRSLPVTTLYPLFVLAFGIGDVSKTAMIFAASLPVIVINSAYGVLNSNPTRRKMARSYGATQAQRFFWITFYDALPQSLVGLRVALSYALIVAVVAEMFMGTQVGIGQRIFEAYSSYALADLYAIILLTGFVGYGLNQAFVLVEHYVVYWGER
jgi:NitT/TauT family transport system permease protein